MSSPCAESPPMGMPLSLAAFSLHRVGSPPHGGSASSESSDGAVSLPSLSGLSASLSNQSSANAPSIDLFTDAHCAKENPLACLSGPVLLGPGHAVQMAALDASRATSGMAMSGAGRTERTSTASGGPRVSSQGDGIASLSLQPKLLKQINSHHTKEELLAYIASCYTLLDDINLVTCIYRLARMFSNVKNLAARMMWSSELLEDAVFFKVLATLRAHMLQAQAQLLHHGNVKGFDARCVCNLVWALVKLEIPMEVGDVGYDLVQAISPLVLFFLQTSSSQGLANLLWAYSKMPVPLVHVIMLIIEEMCARLESDQAEFDAQALSNSIWALAHVRGRVLDLDDRVGGPGMSVRFMLGIASCTLSMLRGLRTAAINSDSANVPACMADAERHFSCQALVNICWSFATMLGDDCNRIPAISDVFVGVRTEALLRLRATASALQLNHAWVHRLQGGFNEQALANLVYAFEKANLLDCDMLSLVYCVAAYRLDRRCNSGQLAFKPQELCTLLRAAQAGIGSTAHPWPFLEKLQRLVASNPRVVSAWTAAECVELERGFALLGVYRLTLMMSQQQAQAQAAQIGAAHQAAAAAAAAAASYGPPIGAGSGHGQLPAGMQLPSTAQLHSAMGVGGMSVSGLGLGMGAFGGLPMHAFLPQQLAGLGV